METRDGGYESVFGNLGKDFYYSIQGFLHTTITTNTVFERDRQKPKIHQKFFDGQAQVARLYDSQDNTMLYFWRTGVRDHLGLTVAFDAYPSSGSPSDFSSETWIVKNNGDIVFAERTLNSDVHGVTEPFDIDLAANSEYLQDMVNRKFPSLRQG